VVSGPEPEGGCIAEASRVDRREQEGCRLEVIRRIQGDLRVEVAPVRRKRREPALPLIPQRLFLAQFLRGSFLSAQQFERSLDAFVIEAPEQPADGLRTDSRTAAVDREGDPGPEAAGIGRRQQCCRALGPPHVVKRQLEAEPRPVVLQTTLELVELFD